VKQPLTSQAHTHRPRSNDGLGLVQLEAEAR